jgi:hypothetical protein
VAVFLALTSVRTTATNLSHGGIVVTLVETKFYYIMQLSCHSVAVVLTLISDK